MVVKISKFEQTINYFILIVYAADDAIDDGVNTTDVFHKDWTLL